MIRVFFFLFGFFLLVAGLTDFVLYLNLLTMGYTILELMHFTLLGFPGLLILVGCSLIMITIFKGKRKKNEYRL